MVEGHSIWHFQADGKEGYPKAVRVPANPRGEIADRAFYAASSIRHVEVATGIQHIGIAAWQSCQQLQIVKLPSSVVSLAEGTFMGCYVLRKVAAPGCVHYGQRVFAECCSLGSVGVSHEAEDSSVLAPGAQLGKYAFESCLTLATIIFDMDRTNKPRALPEGAFCGAGIEQLCLPSDFHNIGPRACENCNSLVEVNLMSTEITALLSSTFAHCVALQCIWLPPRLMQIGKEVFLNCVVLQEVVIPTELSDIGSPDGLGPVRGMPITGRGGPERVRGDVKLLSLYSAGELPEGPRPYRTVNEHGTLVLPSRRVLTCWVAPQVTPSSFFAD